MVPQGSGEYCPFWLALNAEGFASSWKRRLSVDMSSGQHIGPLVSTSSSFDFFNLMKLAERWHEIESESFN